MERRSVDVSKVKRVHLTAVCGAGMAALAGLFKERGYEVRGSDENFYPPMSDAIARLGIQVYRRFSAKNLAWQPDVVIIGNKISRGNAEGEAVLASGIPYLSFPEALRMFFLRGHQSLVVAGTHGKTTSTAMLAWVLEQAGRDPGMMVGGHSLDFDGNYKLGGGAFFVVEGDEYDTAFFDKEPKFLHYDPSAVLLTAVEFDHADIYKDLDAVKTAFRKLLEILPPQAPLVVAADFPHALDVAQGRAAVTFGLDPQASWTIRDLQDDGTRLRMTIWRRGSVEGEVLLRQAGVINARNALGVYVLAREIGLAHREIVPGIESFRGVARRQEWVGEFNGVAVIDDFAHHPTAVAGVIEAVRGRYPERRLWAVFEPRSNTSRRRVFQRDYVDAFARADCVIIGGVYQKASDAIAPEAMFSPAELVADLQAHGKEAWTFSSVGEIVAELHRLTAPGDLILIMSNGDFGGLRGKLVEDLRRRSA